MAFQIEPGMMVFTAEGQEGIAAVRTVDQGTFKIHIENAGEFNLPLTAVKKVHDGKVVVDPALLTADVREALGHIHEAEDPDEVG